jgi:hypothetical protein
MHLVIKILAQPCKSIDCCYKWSYTLQDILVPYIPFQVMNIKISNVPGSNTYPCDLFLQTNSKTELKKVYKIQLQITT